MAPKPVKAPRHLRAATKRWWLDVATDWELDEHHLRLLTLLAEAWDEGQQAREQVRRDGLTVPTKAGGPRVHPCLKIAQDARLAFARLLRELDLDVTAPAEAKRPPILQSMRGGRHAS